MRRETVLTTGMMNCRMFLSWVFLMPASLAPDPLPPMPTASFSSRFCAPFLARCSSCLAMVASVRLEGGTILTGFLCRGLFLRPTGLPGLEAEGEVGRQDKSWSSALSMLLTLGCSVLCVSVPPPLTLVRVLCLPSPPSIEADSCAAAAASALSRSADGGRPRLRRGAPGKVLRRDLRGAVLVSVSLFRLVALDSPRPPLGSFASVS